MFRFLHTADWQLGKPFANVPGDAGAELRRQRLEAIVRIADLARVRQADAVLVAGDAFDSNAVSDRTIHRTLEVLSRFSGAWVFLPGNHDCALSHSVWTRMASLGLPANVVIAAEPRPVDRWDGRANVLPAPLTRRKEAADVTAWFDTASTPEGSCRIGLAHGSVADRLPAAAESGNEIADDRAARAGLCYLALGDWHGMLEVAPRTWYSGAPEPDRFKANASGRVLIVEMDAPGAPPRVEAVQIGHFAWETLDMVLIDGTCRAALDALEGLANPASSIVSLRLTGSITLAERARLERTLAQWEARLHHIEVDDANLMDEPTDDDLDAIDRNGFVRAAVERLRARSLDAADPEREAARMALRLLYLDHMTAGVRHGQA